MNQNLGKPCLMRRLQVFSCELKSLKRLSTELFDLTLLSAFWMSAVAQ